MPGQLIQRKNTFQEKKCKGLWILDVLEMSVKRDDISDPLRWVQGNHPY